MLLSGDPGVGKTLTAESGQSTQFNHIRFTVTDTM
jgi:broad-specificity NMP kinase